MSTSLRSSPDTRSLFLPPDDDDPSIDPLSLTTFVPGAILHAVELNDSFASVLPLSGGAVIGTTSFSRTDAIVNTTPAVQVNYTGKGSSNGILQVNGTGTDGSGFMWGITSNLTLTQNGTGQPVGIASTIFRNSGSGPSFAYFGQILDRSGYGTAPAINTELDLRVCGPEGTTSYYNPSFGGHLGLHISMAAPDLHTAWAASSVFPALAVINPPSSLLYTYISQNAGTSGGMEPAWPTPVNDHFLQAWPSSTVVAAGTALSPPSSPLFTFIATTGGTTGSSEPTWPQTPGSTVVDGGVVWTIATVVDGTITWALGTVYAPQISRALQIAGRSDRKTAKVGTGIYFFNLPVYNALIDGCNNVTVATYSDGTLINPNYAALRIQADWPIDFSGLSSPTGQNVRTLKYNSSTNCFEYQALGTVRFSVSDGPGSVGIGGGAAASGYQLDVHGTNTIGISTALGSFTTGIRVGTDQRIGLDSTDAHYLQFRSATQRLYFVVGGVDKWSVDANGNIRAAGTLTGSTTP